MLGHDRGLEQWGRWHKCSDRSAQLAAGRRGEKRSGKCKYDTVAEWISN